jgi:hypothetical protein
MEMISLLICMSSTLLFNTKILIRFFLFSYDADESTNRTTAAVEAPKPTDVGATNPAPAGESAGQDFTPAPIGTYESHPAQPSEFDQGYHNGSGNAYGAPATTQAPPPAETESHGTGIKEDG